MLRYHFFLKTRFKNICSVLNICFAFHTNVMYPPNPLPICLSLSLSRALSLLIPPFLFSRALPPLSRSLPFSALLLCRSCLLINQSQPRFFCPLRSVKLRRSLMLDKFVAVRQFLSRKMEKVNGKPEAIKCQHNKAKDRGAKA